MSDFIKIEQDEIEHYVTIGQVRQLIIKGTTVKIRWRSIYQCDWYEIPCSNILALKRQLEEYNDALHCEPNLSHRGYKGEITDLNWKTGVYHGQVTGIRDVVTFEATTMEGIERAFRDSVDDYLIFCEQRSEAPDTNVFLARFQNTLPALVEKIVERVSQACLNDISPDRYKNARVDVSNAIIAMVTKALQQALQQPEEAP